MFDDNVMSKGKQLSKSAVRQMEETAGSYSAVMLVLEQEPPSHPAADLSGLGKAQHAGLLP